MIYRFGWQQEEIKSKILMFMLVAAPTGIIANLFTPFVLSKGRRVAMFCGLILVTVGISLNLVENEWFMFAGRIVMGVSGPMLLQA